MIGEFQPVYSTLGSFGTNVGGVKKTGYEQPQSQSTTSSLGASLPAWNGNPVNDGSGFYDSKTEGINGAKFDAYDTNPFGNNSNASNPTKAKSQNDNYAQAAANLGSVMYNGASMAIDKAMEMLMEMQNGSNKSVVTGYQG